MAYNKAFNPDALTVKCAVFFPSLRIGLLTQALTTSHAEPEQAAKEIGKLQERRRSSHPHPANILPTPPKDDMPPGQDGRGAVSPNTYRPRQTFRSQQLVDTKIAHDTFTMNRLNSPPPPPNYGHGPRPANLQRPQIAHQPPSTPRPPPQNTGELNLFPLFRAANVSGSGALSEKELSHALVNSDYTRFNEYTIKCLLRLFSSTPSKSHINYEEFIKLWGFLGAWRDLFVKFDEDKSGYISLQEFSDALVAFGYRLSYPFTALLYNFYNDQANPEQAKKGMSFDLFVQACIGLKRMTDVFKRYDEDRDGYMTVSFEEFLTEVLRLRE